MEIVVTFMMWGQRCETKFSDLTEAIRWLRICYDNGWLYPAEITTSYGVVAYNEDEVLDMVCES